MGFYPTIRMVKMETMADAPPDKWKKPSFSNPLVWLGALVLFLLFLKAVLPQRYVESLPAMLSTEGRCALARQELFNPRDAAAFCEYGINSSNAESQIFVASVWYQHKVHYLPERDAEVKRLLALAEKQLLPRAEKGDRDAQSMLGQLYSHSLLLDGRKAEKWLCAASKQGSSQGFMLMMTLQGGQMFKPLYEGPNAFTPKPVGEFRNGDCVPKPEDLEKPPPVDTTAPARPKNDLIDVLCPYKLESRQDYCDYRHYGVPRF